MPSPYLTDQLMPMQYQDGQNTWQQVGSILNVVNAGINTVSNLYDINYRAEYNKAMETTKRDMLSRNQSMSEDKWWADTQERMADVVNNPELSDGARDGIMKVLDVYAPKDAAIFTKYRDERSIAEITNVASMIDSTYMNETQVKEMVSGLANSYVLPETEVAKALVSGTYSVGLAKLKEVAASAVGTSDVKKLANVVKAFNEQDKLNGLALGKYAINNIMNSKANEASRFYSGLKTDYDRIKGGLLKSVAAPVASELDEINNVLSNPTEELYNNLHLLDTKDVLKKYSFLESVGIDKAQNMRQQFENKYNEVATTANFISQNQDLTKPVSLDALEDEGFIKYQQQRVNQVLQAGRPDDIVGVVQAQDSKFINTFKEYKKKSWSAALTSGTPEEIESSIQVQIDTLQGMLSNGAVGKDAAIKTYGENLYKTINLTGTLHDISAIDPETKAPLTYLQASEVATNIANNKQIHLTRDPDKGVLDEINTKAQSLPISVQQEFVLASTSIIGTYGTDAEATVEKLYDMYDNMATPVGGVKVVNRGNVALVGEHSIIGNENLFTEKVNTIKADYFPGEDPDDITMSINRYNIVEFTSPIYGNAFVKSYSLSGIADYTTSSLMLENYKKEHPYSTATYETLNTIFDETVYGFSLDRTPHIESGKDALQKMINRRN